MIASPRTIDPKSLKRKGSSHEATKQIKLPTSTKKFIKTLSKTLMLRGADIQPGGGILDACLRGLGLRKKKR
jgi:hypothetical protein